MSNANEPELGDIDRKTVKKVLDRYRVTKGNTFKLKDHDPGDTAGRLLGKMDSHLLLQRGVERLSALQERLYAQNQWSLLCCFQAMDAAGKDGTIKHVMSGVNPQGVEITSFKVPGPEELEHDFLWRINRALPARGRIGIFNRSHYEEVLAVRVHPHLLERQNIPPKLVGKKIWRERLESIAAFERYLHRQGVVVLKFFLNVSKDEQKRRFLSRLDEPHKNWKFSAGDVVERGFWDDYQSAYEDAIAATAAPHAPWFVVPADNKWFTRLIVVAAMIDALSALDLR
ncbi:MAG TPA: polyphosphate kinase 2 family protein, partial [Rhodopila sp.]|uniref:polyphosphate kinase 2 family protein n=1 Tax=Rhodopila sp. TaxID=2480087 RepID=UPI002CAAB261